MTRINANLNIDNGVEMQRRVEIFTRWLLARRARSDAPHRDGRAAGPFDFTAHFGFQFKNNF